MTIGGGAIKVTIPLADLLSSSVTVTTVDDVACAMDTYCAPYTLSLPMSAAYLGAFSPGGTSYAPVGDPTVYTVDAKAFQPGSGSTPTCTPSEVMTSLQDDGVTELDFSVSTSPITAEGIDFTGCD
jgi:hypothetical protein